MEEFVGLLRILLTLMFGVLGGLAIAQWRKRRGPAAGWLVGIFVVLGLVAGVDLVVSGLPPSLAVNIVQRIYVGVLGLYPYFLYRLTTTFDSASVWLSRFAVTITGVVVIGALVLEPPEAGSTVRSPEFQVYVVLLAFQWVTLSLMAGVRLWRSGRNQPTVARLRMRTMGVGSGLLTITIILAGLPAATQMVWGLIFRVIALASAPLFLLAHSPPSIVLVLWRRKDESELREVQLQLVKAMSQKQIADALLPSVASLTGAGGAALLDVDAEIISTHLLGSEVVDALRPALSNVTDLYEPTPLDGTLILKLDVGWLVVSISSYTPFFGDEEFNVLKGLAVMSDFALARARLVEYQQKATEAVQDFVAIASHDLRTPATVVQGLAQTLETRWSQFADEEKIDLLRSITRQTSHLNRLIEDLLTVSRLDVRAIMPEVSPTDLTALVRQVVQDTLLSIEVQIDAPSEILSAMVDPDHARRIIENYLKNASVYGRSPIGIQITHEPFDVVVCVSDSGDGVPASLVPRLFEKFARAERKQDRATKGTGLGLSIVKGLAEANGGRAWYEPNLPSGSKFLVRLPAVKAA